MHAHDGHAGFIEGNLPLLLDFVGCRQGQSLGLLQYVLRKRCKEVGVPFLPRGAGTSLAGGCLPVGGGVLVPLTRMKTVHEVNYRDRYAVVDPGVVNLQLTRLLQPHAASAIVAARMLADQLNARAIERIDHLDQRFHHAADRAGRGFHPLDGRQRHAGEFGQGLLVDPEQRPGRPHLERRDQVGLNCRRG